MSHTHIETELDAQRLADALDSAPRIALDCEAAGFHRYANRLCLLQISTEHETFVVDPLGFDAAALLQDVLERPDVPVLMHGADFDLRLLRGDLGIRLQGLFDTQIAASLLGVEGLGLAALLEARFGVKLSKKYQRADWAERPLSPDMLEYAANDTRYLLALADQLAAELTAAGRSDWAEQECRELERAADAPAEELEPEDPVVRVKGARDLSPRQVTALREALVWRDEIARAKDKAMFRVIGDAPLIEAVARHPQSVQDLLEVKGFPSALARADGPELIRRLEQVVSLPEEELRPYPRSTRRGPGRAPPETEALTERLKGVRNRQAEQIGLPRGTLLSNAVVEAVALKAPTRAEDLAEIEGMRPWKMKILGPALLDVLRSAG